MKYLDKNGKAYNSEASMRLADIRHTNIVEAVKEVPNKVRDKVSDIINSRPNFGDKYNNSAEDLMFEEDYGCNFDEVENIKSEEPQNLPEVCITKEEPEEGTITNIWYNINLQQWQFEEAGNPSIVIKTPDEMTQRFSNVVYNRAADSLRRGEKLLVNLMYSVANKRLPVIAELGYDIDVIPVLNPEADLRILIDNGVSISLRIVVEVSPSNFGTVSDIHYLGPILSETIIALQKASRQNRPLT